MLIPKHKDLSASISIITTKYNKNEIIEPILTVDFQGINTSAAKFQQHTEDFNNGVLRDFDFHYGETLSISLLSSSQTAPHSVKPRPLSVSKIPKVMGGTSNTPNAFKYWRKNKLLALLIPAATSNLTSAYNVATSGINLGATIKKYPSMMHFCLQNVSTDAFASAAFAYIKKTPFELATKTIAKDPALFLCYIAHLDPSYKHDQSLEPTILQWDKKSLSYNLARYALILKQQLAFIEPHLKLDEASHYHNINGARIPVIENLMINEIINRKKDPFDRAISDSGDFALSHAINYTLNKIHGRWDKLERTMIDLNHKSPSVYSLMYIYYKKVEEATGSFGRSWPELENQLLKPIQQSYLLGEKGRGVAISSLAAVGSYRQYQKEKGHISEGSELDALLSLLPVNACKPFLYNSSTGDNTLIKFYSEQRKNILFETAIIMSLSQANDQPTAHHGQKQLDAYVASGNCTKENLILIGALKIKNNWKLESDSTAAAITKIIKDDEEKTAPLKMLEHLVLDRYFNRNEASPFTKPLLEKLTNFGELNPETLATVKAKFNESQVSLGELDQLNKNITEITEKFINAASIDDLMSESKKATDLITEFEFSNRKNNTRPTFKRGM